MAPPVSKMAHVNGIDLSYTDEGAGPPVVMIMGSGAPGRVWHAHQQPALVRAGYRVVTFDNRGIAPSSECGDGFTLDDMVADTAALIELLGVGRASVVGTSLGGRIAAELALARPDLVAAVIIMASYARPSPMDTAMSIGEREIYDQGITLPASFRAAVSACMNLSPATLRSDAAARDWLDIIEFSGGAPTPGMRAQMGVHETRNRIDALRAIAAPTLVIGFADDRTLPPVLSAEIADAIPGAVYAQVADAGHWGYLERPAEVNRLLIDFLATAWL